MIRGIREFFEKYMITDLDVQLKILRMWKDNFVLTKIYPFNLTSEQLDKEINFLTNFIIKLMLEHIEVPDNKGGGP